MGWLMTLLIGLALLAGLALWTSMRGSREMADDTPAGQLDGWLPPAAQAQREVAAPPAPPAPAAAPAGEGGWLENQLGWLKAWSQWMQEQIAYRAADPDSGWLENRLADITACSQRTEEQVASQLAPFRSSSSVLPGPGPGLARAQQPPASQGAEDLPFAEPAPVPNAHRRPGRPPASRMVTNGRVA